MIDIASPVRKLGWLATAVLALLVQSCSGGAEADNSGTQMSQGLSEARNGAAQTQTGMDQMDGGARQAGTADVTAGMGLMNQGMTGMRGAMDTMSAEMVKGCCDGIDAVVGPMQQAWDEMRQGQAMLTDVQADNDTDGMSHMQNGMTMMKTALDQAQVVMNCMGHGSSGGSMMSENMH